MTATLGLMKQHALAAGHLNLKAAVLNSASKHVMSRIPNDPIFGGPNPAASFDGKAWPVRYSCNPNPMFITTSKDNEMGLGQLNALAAVKQIPTGGDVSTLSDSVGANTFYDSPRLAGGETLERGALVTATVVWDRTVTNAGSLTSVTDYGPAIAPPANPQVRLPVDIDLELMKVGQATPVARARSSVDNVEHLYFNVREEGEYFLRVHNFDAAPVGRLRTVDHRGHTDGMTFSVDGGFFNPWCARDPAEGRNPPFNGRSLPE